MLLSKNSYKNFVCNNIGSKINVGVTNYIWYSLFQHFCYDKRKTPKRHRLPNKRTWRYIKDV